MGDRAGLGPAPRPCGERRGRLLFPPHQDAWAQRAPSPSSQHQSSAGRAAGSLGAPCRCRPAGVMLGHRGAGCLQPPSPFPAQPPSFLLLSSCPQLRGPKSQGKVGKGRKRMELGGTARGCSGGGWAAGSDGEVRLPLLSLRQLLTWLDVVVLDEAIVIVNLQVGSTRRGVALTGLQA